MAVIHGRRRNRQWQYRLWDNVNDLYLTVAITRAALRAELLCNYTVAAIRDGWADREIENRLQRVHRYGTSSTNYLHRRCINGPWENEREITPEERYGDENV